MKLAVLNSYLCNFITMLIRLCSLLYICTLCLVYSVIASTSRIAIMGSIPCKNPNQTSNLVSRLLGLMSTGLYIEGLWAGPC